MNDVNDMNETNGTVIDDTDDGMSVPITELRTDLDLDDPRCGLKIAAERLSIVRYVFLVQIEDGIASASQRASLEYADAVLIGWPDEDAPDVVDLDDAQLKAMRGHMEMMEEYIARFSALERDGDVDGMTDTLIRVTERVAEVRRMFQPDFPLPTFAEIRRVVQDEWDEDMGKIDPKDDDPTAADIEQETEQAEERESDGTTAGDGIYKGERA
ncbi:phosphoribosylglycinamide synthetase [Bifidobacterium callitrichos]|uniref:phosphoribosylglycinamide synthetase n=1 Tax=Bifidobacterium callitrichos TaxID=762209 RepID=UPI0037BF7266